MPVLAIDTARDQCAAAVSAAGRILSLRAEPMGRGHAERLAPMVAEALADAGLRPGAVARIIVTTGPGSFTGVRVGLAFARAFAAALDRPCVGISTLEALALAEGEAGLRGAWFAAPGGAFAALYEDAAPRQPPAHMSLEALAALQAAYPSARWAGEGDGPAMIEALALRAARLDPQAYPPDPLYLRPPGADLPKDPL